MYTRSKRKLSWLKAACPLALLAALNAPAQMNTPNDNIVPPSPEATAFSKYVEMPVSLYTGVPQIAVPLWKLSDKDLEASVGLSYHAAGNKVEDIAPRTGLGWTLQAGGTVSRVVRGQADEYPNYGFLGVTTRFTYTTLHSGTSQQRYERYKEFAEGCDDAEPDIFYFSVGGLAGQFCFNWNRTLTISCNQKVIIEKLASSDPAYPIGGWQITGPDGTKYIFDVKEISEVIPDINTTPDAVLSQECRQRTPVTTWHLARIISNSGRQMQFTYKDYELNYQLTSGEQRSHRYGYQANQNTTTPVRKIKVRGKALHKITDQAGNNIEFVGNSLRGDISAGIAMYQLDEIVVKNYQNIILRRFLLGYDYSSGRLTLRSVTDADRNGVALGGVHRFEYDPAVLPPVNSYSQDHWGYANNNSTGSLIPSYDLYNPFANTWIYKPGANREPSLAQTKSGILTKLTYPTGGTVSFEYEPNSYSFIRNQKLESNVVTPRTVAAGAYGTYESYPVMTDTKQFTLTAASSVTIDYTLDAADAWAPYNTFEDVPTIKIRNSSGQEVFSRFSDISQSDRARIDLPAGTYTLFASAMLYQDQAYATLTWDEVSSQTTVQVKKAGGLRIKSIREHDGINAASDRLRTFDYTMTEAGKTFSSGVTSGEIKYKYEQYSLEYPYEAPTGTFPIDDFIYVPYTIIQTSSRAQLSTSKGSMVTYRRVGVSYGTNGRDGLSVSEFTSEYEFPSGIADDMPFSPPASMDYTQGLPLVQTEYKYENGAFSPVSRTSYTYKEKYDQVNALKIGIKTGGMERTTVMDYNERFALGFYIVPMAWKQVDSVVTEKYMQGKTFRQAKLYTYDTDVQLVKKETSRVSAGRELSTEYYYPQDYVSPSAIITEMKRRNMVNSPIEQLQTEKGTDGQTRVIGGAYTEYGSFGAQLTTALIRPSKELKLLAASPITGLSLSVNNTNGIPAAGRYGEVLALTSYDAAGNLLEKKHFGKPTSYIWGYKGTVPVAAIENAPAAHCAYADFEETGSSGNWQYDGSSANHSITAKTGTLSYMGTLTSQVLPAGKYRVTMWVRQAGTSPVSVGGVTQPVSSTGWNLHEWEITLSASGSITVATNGNLVDAVRLHPAGSMMTTYTYSQGVGVTHVADANNLINLYEYDSLGRLQTVRDHKGDIVKNYQYQFAN